MVHVEKFKVKGNTYYKLVHSIRIGKKITSKSKYLGKTLPEEEQLQKLKDLFYQQVLVQRKKQKSQSSKNVKTPSKNNPNLSFNKLPVQSIDNASSTKKHSAFKHSQNYEPQISDDSYKKSQSSDKSDLQFATKYLNLIENLQDLIFSLDSNGNFTYINSSVSYHLGYHPIELIGKPLTKIVSKKYQESIGQYLKVEAAVAATATTTTNTLTLELELISRYNLAKLFSLQINIQTQDHRIHSLNCIARDISKERSTQKNLTQLQKDQYNQLFEYSPVPLIELDYSKLKNFIINHKLNSDQKIENHFQKNPSDLDLCVSLVSVHQANSKALKLFLAKDFSDFAMSYPKNKFFRTESYTFIDEIKSIARQELEFESSIDIKTLDKKDHQISYRMLVPSQFKDSYSRVIISLIDTTSQRKFHKLMMIKNQAVEASQSAIVVTDELGKIKFANNAFYNLLQVQADVELSNMNIKTYLPDKKLTKQMFKELSSNQSWTGEIVLHQKIQESIQETNQETSQKNKQGDSIFLKCNANYLGDDYNETLGVIFSFANITELKRTEQIRLDFTNIAAHELKTPVTPLKTFLSMMKDDPKTFGINQKGLDNIDVCLRNVLRLNSLIGDILDISKLEAHGMNFNFELIDFNEIINQQINDFSDIAKQKNINLDYKQVSNIPKIIADKFRIAQVISNLIRNSIKFTDKGSIKLNLNQLDDFIQVDVVDTGAGISKQDIPKLFTKFFQAADITTRKTKGTGLGLAISKEIVQAHQGQIWATSEGKGTGSTFSFKVPIKMKIDQKSKENTLADSNDSLSKQMQTADDQVILSEPKSKLKPSKSI